MMSLGSSSSIDELGHRLSPFFFGLSHGIIRIFRPCWPVTSGDPIALRWSLFTTRRATKWWGGTGWGQFGDPSSFRFRNIRMVFFTPRNHKPWFFTMSIEDLHIFGTFWYHLDGVETLWMGIAGIPMTPMFHAIRKKSSRMRGSHQFLYSTTTRLNTTKYIQVLWYGLTTPHIQMFLTLTSIWLNAQRRNFI
jgi:hypothetical protein